MVGYFAIDLQMPFQESSPGQGFSLAVSGTTQDLGTLGLSSGGHFFDLARQLCTTMNCRGLEP